MLKTIGIFLATICFLMIQVSAHQRRISSKPPIPRAGEIASPNQQKPAAHDQTTADHERGTPAAPLIIEMQNPPNTSEIAAELKKNRDDQTAENWRSNVFNSLLVGVGVLQVIALGFTVFVTNKAANAAKAAAEALPIVERAYVYPIVISAEAVADRIQSASWLHLDDSTKGDVPATNTAEITFRIKNYGKTPAILKSAWARLDISPVGDEIGIHIPEAILGAMETTDKLSARMEVGLTRNQANKIMVYHAELSFSGTIIFDDIWGNELATEFIFVWNKDIQRMALRHIETKTKQKST